MADLTISVPDLVVPRIRAALFRTENDGTQRPATPSEVETDIKGWLKSRVLSHEADIAAITKVDEVNQEVW